MWWSLWILSRVLSCAALIVLKVMKRELDPVLWCAKRRYTSFIPSWDISIWPHYTPHNHGIQIQWEFPVPVWRLSELRNSSLQAISAHTSRPECVCNIYCGDSNPRREAILFTLPRRRWPNNQNKVNLKFWKFRKISQLLWGNSLGRRLSKS